MRANTVNCWLSSDILRLLERDRLRRPETISSHLRPRSRNIQNHPQKKSLLLLATPQSNDPSHLSHAVHTLPSFLFSVSEGKPKHAHKKKRGIQARMAQLLHLPGLAAARPPAGGGARRRRAVAAAAGGRVKQEEAGKTGEAGGRVIRVADPVREGRLLPPPLFSVPVTPASESPAAARQREEDEEGRRRYYLNMGYAIRTLREELPDVFCKEPSFDIYRDDIVFKDPFNKFKGIDNYKRIFWVLRFTGQIFFKALWVDIVSIWQPAENLIMIRWIAHGIPRVPWEGHGRFDGASEYKLDKNGKIYEHKVHNVAMNPPTKFKVLPVHELIRSLGCPSTPKPTYFEASSQSLSAAPFYLRLAWIRCYVSLCRMLSLANLG